GALGVQGRWGRGRAWPPRCQGRVVFAFIGAKRETLDPGEAGGPGADFRQEGQKDGTCGRNLQWRRMGLRAGLLRIDMRQASLETPAPCQSANDLRAVPSCATADSFPSVHLLALPAYTLRLHPPLLLPHASPASPRLPLRSDKRENHAPLTARRPGAPAPPATLNAQGSEVSNSPVAAGSGINHSVSSRVVNENFGQPAATAQAQAQLGRVAQASYQC